MERGLDACLFDFGGTLDADGEPAVEQFHRAYRAAGGRRTLPEFEAIFRVSDRRVAEHPGIRGLGFSDTVEVQSLLLASLVPEERLRASAIADHVRTAVRAMARRNMQLLELVRARGLRTALVSNFTGNLECCIAELGLAPSFDAIVDSAVVGVRKPNPKIFTIALEQLGVEPPRALMVGDNPSADIRGAAAIGMSTCWLAPLSRDVPEDCNPTFRIESLAALPEALDALRSTLNARRECTA